MDFNEQDSIPEAITKRKGARKASEIPPNVIELLNIGRIESVNLTEWLAVDHIELLRHIMAELGLQQHAADMLSMAEGTEGQSTMKIIAAVAGQWLKLLGKMIDEERASVFERLAMHRSDSVRCWAAYIVGLNPIDLEQKLSHIRRFASDHHFGVREIAWMAVRDEVPRQLEHAIQLLSGWIREDDANLRRFAVELTRPRGVWARHITELKETPQLGLPLLEPLKADPSKYVQDSIANWLNDASKSRPEWVVQVCSTWQEVSDDKATKRIAARALRSVKQ